MEAQGHGRNQRCPLLDGRSRRILLDDIRVPQERYYSKIRDQCSSGVVHDLHGLLLLHDQEKALDLCSDHRFDRYLHRSLLLRLLLRHEGIPSSRSHLFDSQHWRFRCSIGWIESCHTPWSHFHLAFASLYCQLFGIYWMVPLWSS